MLRTFIRSLFVGGSTSAAPSRSAAPNTAPTPPVDPYKALVTAIRELRAVVDTGTAEQIAPALEVFKEHATAGDPDVREVSEHEVLKAEPMLTVLAYVDRLDRVDGVQAVAVMPAGESSYFRAPRVFRETARGGDHGQLDIGDTGIFTSETND